MLKPTVPSDIRNSHGMMALNYLEQDFEIRLVSLSASNEGVAE